jgi:hypothetical protein
MGFLASTLTLSPMSYVVVHVEEKTYPPNGTFLPLLTCY